MWTISTYIEERLRYIDTKPVPFDKLSTVILTINAHKFLSIQTTKTSERVENC